MDNLIDDTMLDAMGRLGDSGGEEGDSTPMEAFVPARGAVRPVASSFPVDNRDARTQPRAGTRSESVLAPPSIKASPGESVALCACRLPALTHLCLV